MCSSILVVFEMWNSELTAITLFWAAIEYFGGLIIFTSVIEGLVHLGEKQESAKGFVKVSSAVSITIFIFALLVKSRM